MQDEMAKNPGFVQRDTDLRLNKPEIAWRWTASAADLGVGVDAVARAWKPCWAGAGDALQARRRAVRRDRADQASGPHTPEDIDRIFVRGRNDTMIPLSALVKVREVVVPRELNHFGQRRSATITANLAPDYSLGEALAFMDDAAKRAQARLRHRPERHLARVPQFVGLAGAGVRAGAAVHLPGAGGAVRELCRPASSSCWRCRCRWWARCWRCNGVGAR
jgi:multidrug efflux pump subunit AcrB